MVLRRLAGRTENTAPVLTLVTQFGGGKTHTLTSLYHLANAGPKAADLPGVTDLLAAADMPAAPAARVGVFVGNAWDPSDGRETPLDRSGAPTRGRSRRRCARHGRAHHASGDRGAGQDVRRSGRSGAAAVRRSSELRQPPSKYGREFSRLYSEPDRRRHRRHGCGGGHQPAAQPGRDDRLGPAVAGPDHQGGSAE